MLQLPQPTKTFPIELLPCQTARSAKPKQAAAMPSELDRAVNEHKAAARLWRNREADLEKLYVQHPDIRHENVPHFRNNPEGWKAARIRRRRHGVLAADNVACAARRAERLARRRFIDTKPRSKTEVARYARCLILVIENEVGGRFNPNIGAEEVIARGGLEECERREREAFNFLHQAVRSLARRV